MAQLKKTRFTKIEAGLKLVSAPTTVKLNNLSAGECNLVRKFFQGTLDGFYLLSRVSVRACACQLYTLSLQDHCSHTLAGCCPLDCQENSLSANLVLWLPCCSRQGMLCQATSWTPCVCDDVSCMTRNAQPVKALQPGQRCPAALATLNTAAKVRPALTRRHTTRRREQSRRHPLLR
jgi:hypothetical protein